jgi:hypothetical protein
MPVGFRKDRRLPGCEGIGSRPHDHEEETMKIRSLSPATVIATIALLFALSGTAVAGSSSPARTS